MAAETVGHEPLVEVSHVDQQPPGPLGPHQERGDPYRRWRVVPFRGRTVDPLSSLVESRPVTRTEPSQVPVVEPTAAVRLVMGVARLGEGDLARWWSSQGLNPAVRFALAGFRRTGTVIGAELALLSAARRHLQILPRPTAVHLFSAHLPFIGWTRAYLAEQKTVDTSELLEELHTWTSTDLATSALRVWRSAVGSIKQPFETITSDGLADRSVTTALLGHFVDGYLTQSGELSVPYVDLVS